MGYWGEICFNYPTGLLNTLRYCILNLERAVVQWLRHYATNRQVAGSIPDGVIGIFQWHNRSGRTMSPGSTQPLTEMSTKCISWGKGGRCARLTTLPPSCAVVMKTGNLNFLELSGPLQACNGTALPATVIFRNIPWKWDREVFHVQWYLS